MVFFSWGTNLVVRDWKKGRKREREGMKRIASEVKGYYVVHVPWIKLLSLSFLYPSVTRIQDRTKTWLEIENSLWTRSTRCKSRTREIEKDRGKKEEKKKSSTFPSPTSSSSCVRHPFFLKEPAFRCLRKIATVSCIIYSLPQSCWCWCCCSNQSKLNRLLESLVKGRARIQESQPKPDQMKREAVRQPEHRVSTKWIHLHRR